jgi:hypothetical protein
VTQLHAKGVNFTAPAGSATERATLRRIVESAVADGARPALLFAAAIVSVGAVLSLLIPRVAHDAERSDTVGVESVNAYESFDNPIGARPRTSGS